MSHIRITRRRSHAEALSKEYGIELIRVADGLESDDSVAKLAANQTSLLVIEKRYGKGVLDTIATAPKLTGTATPRSHSSLIRTIRRTSAWSGTRHERASLVSNLGRAAHAQR